MKSMMSRIVDRHDGPMKHAEIILAEDAKRSAMMLELCIQEKIRNGFKPSLQPLLVAAPSCGDVLHRGTPSDAESNVRNLILIPMTWKRSEMSPHETENLFCAGR